MIIYYYKKYRLIVSICIGYLWTTACSKYTSKFGIGYSEGPFLAKDSVLDHRFIADVLTQYDPIQQRNHILEYLENELNVITTTYFTTASDSALQSHLVNDLNHLLKLIRDTFKQNKPKELEELAKIIYSPILGYHKPSTKDSGKPQPILIHAVNIGDVEMVDVLFNFFSYAIPDQYDTIFSQKFGPGGYTIIHQAVAEGNFAILKYLIGKYIAIKKASGSSEDTALSSLKFILTMKNNVNQNPVDMALAECCCIENKYSVEICNYLLQYGDLNINCKSGQTKTLENIKNIYNASFDIFKDIMNSLLKNGISGKEKIEAILNLADNGHTLLHQAVLKNNEEVISYLIDLGALWTNCDKNHESPMSIAIAHHNLEVVKLLLTSSECNINAQQGKHKVTALHYASGYNTFKLPDTIQLSDHTIDKQINIIDTLLDHGADLSIKNNIGDTPLHQAIKSKMHDRIVEHIIEKGAHTLTLIPDNNNYTALDLLAYNIPMSYSTSRYAVAPLYANSKEDHPLNLFAQAVEATIRKQFPQSERKEANQLLLEISTSIKQTYNSQQHEGMRHAFIKELNKDILQDYGVQLTLLECKCKHECPSDKSLVSTKKRKTGVCNGSSSGKNQGG